MRRPTRFTSVWACSASSRDRLVVSADFAWKRFIHTFINGIDYNRWNSAAGPVIPACTGAQLDDVMPSAPTAPSISTPRSAGPAIAGLLVRVEKRFSRRTQFLASYALGSFVGTNGYRDRHVRSAWRPGFWLQQRQLVRELRPAADRPTTPPESLGIRRAPVAVAACLQRRGVQRGTVRALREQASISTATGRSTICCRGRRSTSSGADWASKI